MSDELLPCPNCGNIVKVYGFAKDEEPMMYDVFCHHCLIKSKACNSKLEAIKTWNTRMPKTEEINFQTKR